MSSSVASDRPSSSADTAAGRPGTANGARWALAAALLGFFVMTLDALIVNVALPEIGRGLGGGMTGLQWVVDGYTLMFAALLLSAGSVTDRIGARQAFGAGLVVFTVASAACGFAPNLGVLVVARLVQGAGAAAGPVVGGVLSELGWRMIFFVNLPVGVLALFLLARTARSPRRGDAPFDWTGQIAAVAAMGGLTYAAIEAGAVGSGTPRVLLALAVAVVAAVVFLVAQARGRNPMVPLELLRARTMALSATIGFALNVGFYGMIFLLGLYLQQEQGLSPMATGLAFLPMTLLTAVVSPAAARLAARFGPRMPIVTGQLLMATGLVALCVPPASAPAWVPVLLMIPVGTGGGLAVPAVTSLLLDRVPAQRAGTASGVLNASRQLGGALSVAIFGALVSHHQHFLHGLRTSLLTAALLVVLTAVASVRVKEKTS
ncbi:MFS transporter [Streptomyces sp. 303MFCol5.2]|uniref:MFS transporter n=1 Tax=Streptomyces sp. 303MFCol5.2 TaxID=1172181 RepID=UPI0003609162|nr:MFS transporter [Streptomyces sp. 303MFCol5.2]